MVEKPYRNIKQHQLINDYSKEVFFGGAGGGGKSSGLLMAASQFVHDPFYNALIIRKSYADLSLPGALMDRAQEWWSGTAARYDDKQHTWIFPSGATITFGYLEGKSDHYRYRSSEFQCICFDELTTFAENQYRYLFSRLRVKDALKARIPLRMRSASNPGGIGHEWVKRRFITDGTRTFIPARLDDNPYIDKEGYVSSLQELDPVTRAQIMAGDWDEYAGGRFLREWLRFYTVDKHRQWRFGDDSFPVERIRNRFLTVDPAATAKSVASRDPDYTVISAWATNPLGHLVWLGCSRYRIEVPEIPARIAEEYLRHHADRVHIESGGTQKAVAQLTRAYKLDGHKHMNVIEYVPGSKDLLQRAAKAVNLAYAGRLWLPLANPLFPSEDVVSELLRFTGDQRQQGHDDIVSSLAIAANVFERGGFQRIDSSSSLQTVRAGLDIRL